MGVVVLAVEVEMPGLEAATPGLEVVSAVAAVSAAVVATLGAEVPLEVVEALIPVPFSADSMQMGMVCLTPANSKDLHNF